MALTRYWTPSGNYSSGSKKRLLVIHTMEGFTGPNGAKDCAIYFQGNVGASSQVCIDNNRGKLWECVARDKGAWTQCNFNSVSVSMEQCGYASWSRDKWLKEREPQLRNVADWIKEEVPEAGHPDQAAELQPGAGWQRGYLRPPGPRQHGVRALRSGPELAVGQGAGVGGRV